MKKQADSDSLPPAYYHRVPFPAFPSVTLSVFQMTPFPSERWVVTYVLTLQFRLI